MSLAVSNEIRNGLLFPCVCVCEILAHRKKHVMCQLLIISSTAATYLFWNESICSLDRSSLYLMVSCLNYIIIE